MTNTWYFAPPLPQHRMSASVAILEDRIFLIGGYDGFTTYRTIFIYHHGQSFWRQLQYELPVHLSGSDAIVITDMINTMDYSYYGQCSNNNDYIEKFYHNFHKSLNHHDDDDDENHTTILNTAKRIWHRIRFNQKNNFHNRKFFFNYLQNEWQKFRNNHHQQQQKNEMNFH